MKVKDILQAKGLKVWSIKEKENIESAVKTLVEQKIGALLVINDKNDIVGIITERDIMRALHQYGEKLPKTLVSKAMTEKVIIGTPEDELEYIMNVMTYNRVRHIPVMEDKHIHGMVSIGDVVKAQLRDSQAQIKYLKDYMQGS